MFQDDLKGGVEKTVSSLLAVSMAAAGLNPRRRVLEVLTPRSLGHAIARPSSRAPIYF